jgi:hypothetical protein
VPGAESEGLEGERWGGVRRGRSDGVRGEGERREEEVGKTQSIAGEEHQFPGKSKDRDRTAGLDQEKLAPCTPFPIIVPLSSRLILLQDKMRSARTYLHAVHQFILNPPWMSISEDNRTHGRRHKSPRTETAPTCQARIELYMRSPRTPCTPKAQNPEK